MQNPVEVPQGPPCYALSSLVNPSADELALHAAAKAVLIFRDVLSLLKDDRFTMDDRTSVLCCLKCLISEYLSFDEYAMNLRQIIGDHPLLSEENRQIVVAALPILQEKMRTCNFFVDGVSVNEEFGVFVHHANPEGQAVVSLFATGLAECAFGCQGTVHDLCENIIRRAREAEIGVQSTLPIEMSTPPTSFQVFRSLLFCLNEVSFPTAELACVLGHLKCLIVGLIETRKFLEMAEPLLSHLRYRYSSIQKITLAYMLSEAIPTLRKAMEIADVIIDGCNINRELGVFVHDPEGAPMWSTMILMAGKTECRLGIDDEVRKIVLDLTNSGSPRTKRSPVSKEGSASNGSKVNKQAKPKITNGGTTRRKTDVVATEDRTTSPVKIEEDHVSDVNGDSTSPRMSQSTVSSSIESTQSSSTPKTSRVTVPLSQRTLRSMTRTSQESCKSSVNSKETSSRGKQRPPRKRKALVAEEPSTPMSAPAKIPKTSEVNMFRRVTRLLASRESLSDDPIKETPLRATQRMTKKQSTDI